MFIIFKMPSCFIKSCKMSYKNKPHDITFHRFPVPMKQAWLSAMGKDPALDISHTSVICSSHFKPKDFEEYGVQRRLKKDSVPSLKLEPVPRNIHLVAPDVRIYAALDTVEPTTTVLPTITPPISAPIHSSAESTLNKCAIPSNANEFSTVCRTCLKPSGKMRSLYEVCPSSTTNICFAEMLLSFTPLKCFGNDGLPAQICLNCIGELNRCNAFKLKCLKSDGILRNWIDEVGKTEECFPFQEVVIKTEENITEDDQLICLDTIEPNCSNIKSLNSPLTMSEIKNIIEQKIDLIEHDVDMQIKVEDDLPLEINNTSETTDKPYNCTYCVKSFTRSAHLIVHMRKHTGEKPFLCHVCDSSFSHKSSLTAHLRVHTGEKPYSCVVCDSSFYERSTLNVHMRKHTEERPYSCLICSDSFNHKSTLTCHMRKHTGERPYACTNCDLSFTQKQHLTTHLRTHTGEKPYRCTVCNNTFTQNNIMSHSCNVRSTENTRRTTHDEEQIDQEVFNLGSSDRITRESLDKEQIVHDAFNLLELDEDGESDADVEVSDHNTDTEQSQSEDSDDNAGSNAENNKNCLLGRDKITRWELDLPNQKIRTNIITHLPGGKGSAKDVNSIVDIWKLFFPLTTIQEIVLYTNVYLEKLRVDSRYQRVTDVQATNVNEVYALIGLLFLIGLKHGSHLNLRELWCTDGTAPDIFRAVMSMRRFYLLLTALRFDDINTREDRKKLDNLAPIRKFTDDFIERCQQLYTPGEFLTIDEMLESFRGRCKFRQYIANKPAKYGIKIYALVDSKTFYTLKMDIYAGKQPEGPYRQSNSAFDVVKRLSSPVLNTGRNLTMDNYFTSVPLAQDLFKNHKTTMVGTVRKNKKELPHEFLDTKNRSVASSRFAFCNGSILVSYIPKKNKNVLVLSTMHQSNEIDAESGQKPEIITFYNSTKGGVDTVDELKGNYSTARETNRWPMVLFYSFLNISSINAQIIYNCNTAADPKSISNITRREFLKELAFNLIQPHLLDRIKEPRLTVELRQIISKITKLKSETVTEENTSANKEFCSFCPRRKNRRTKKKCSYCSLSICNEHSAFLCMHCETKLKKHDEDCQFN